eukprot:m51a1_g3559 hypothetical protein (964) ;mRNA; f:1042693-1046558
MAAAKEVTSDHVIERLKRTGAFDELRRSISEAFRASAAAPRLSRMALAVVESVPSVRAAAAAPAGRSLVGIARQKLFAAARGAVLSSHVMAEAEAAVSEFMGSSAEVDALVSRRVGEAYDALCRGDPDPVPVPSVKRPLPAKEAKQRDNAAHRESAPQAQQAKEGEGEKAAKRPRLDGQQGASPSAAEPQDKPSSPSSTHEERAPKQRQESAHRAPAVKAEPRAGSPPAKAAAAAHAASSAREGKPGAESLAKTERPERKAEEERCPTTPVVKPAAVRPQSTPERQAPKHQSECLSPAKAARRPPERSSSFMCAKCHGAVEQTGGNLFFCPCCSKSLTIAFLEKGVARTPTPPSVSGVSGSSESSSGGESDSESGSDGDGAAATTSADDTADASSRPDASNAADSKSDDGEGSSSSSSSSGSESEAKGKGKPRKGAPAQRKRNTTPPRKARRARSDSESSEWSSDGSSSSGGSSSETEASRRHRKTAYTRARRPVTRAQAAPGPPLTTTGKSWSTRRQNPDAGPPVTPATSPAPEWWQHRGSPARRTSTRMTMPEAHSSSECDRSAFGSAAGSSGATAVGARACLRCAACRCPLTTAACHMLDGGVYCAAHAPQPQPSQPACAVAPDKSPSPSDTDAPAASMLDEIPPGKPVRGMCIVSTSSAARPARARPPRRRPPGVACTDPLDAAEVSHTLRGLAIDSPRTAALAVPRMRAQVDVVAPEEIAGSMKACEAATRSKRACVPDVDDDVVDEDTPSTSTSLSLPPPVLEPPAGRGAAMAILDAPELFSGPKASPALPRQMEAGGDWLLLAGEQLTSSPSSSAPPSAPHSPLLHSSAPPVQLPTPREETRTVHFSCLCGTRYGDKLFLTGSSEELGKWKALAVPMQYVRQSSGTHEWAADVRIVEQQAQQTPQQSPQQQQQRPSLQYKYVLLDSTGRVWWEQTANRILPPSYTAVFDIFGSLNY